MSFFDDASLVMIPSGYKDQKVYSVKPTDGTGDLTFSRASSATRVASNGLIEKVRENLQTYSQDFTNVGYTKSNVTASISGTAPDATATANLITENTATGDHRFYKSNAFINGVSYTASIYFKSGNKQYVSLNGAIWCSGNAVFDIINGTVSQQNSCTASIQSVGNGWYRCSITALCSAASASYNTPVQGNSGATFNDTYTGTGETWYAWGYQVEVSDFGATPYIATTSAAVSVGPVSGLPRLDYLNSTCPRLLLEPQRTNTLTYSEQIDNADWLKLNSTIAANTSDTLDPAGYNGADKITDNSTNGAHFVYRFSTWDTTQRTASVYAKAGTSSRVCILNGTTNAGVFANLSSGTISVSAGFTGTITSVGNGWYRITATHTAASSQTFAIGLYTGTNTTDYVGTGSYAYLWGLQQEAGAYATSYIPTLGTSVTRVADAASKTGISSLIGQTEGTLFAEFVVDSSSSPTMAFFVSAAGVFDNAIWIQQSASDSVIFRVFSGSSAQASITKTGLTNGQTVKVAGAYKANDFVLYVNGVQVGTDTSGSIPASLSQIEIGSYAEVGSPFNQNRPIKQAILFPTRLSNSDLAALTA
jgi:hypothetical protein